jgi:peptidoglycan/LPS O-acetylase OafA/YrhL
LLHSVLGFDALSAGAWYVAMDFQLFAVMALLLHLGYRVPGLPRLAHWLVVGLMLASLFYFNHFAAWDAWALYFFGAYGLGAAARWIDRSRYPEIMLILLVAHVACALWLEFRERIALALAVAVLLGLSQWAHVRGHHWSEVRPPVARVVHALSKISYALFLIHFPVLLLGNALFAYLELAGPEAAGAMLLACWAASTAAAIGFAHWVEAPLAHWGYKRSLLPPGSTL